MEFKKMHILIAKSSYNLNINQIIEIFLVLYNVYIICKDHNKVVFDINNYINQNQFKKLYNLNQIKNSIQNANTVAYKLKSTLIKIINY